MKLLRNKKFVVIMLNVIGIILYVVLGLSSHRDGPTYVHNCSDVGGVYERCYLHNIRYGLPFTYAEGYPLIPGDSYNIHGIKAVPLIANAVVWIAVLPSLYLLLTRKK